MLVDYRDGQNLMALVWEDWTLVGNVTKMDSRRSVNFNFAHFYLDWRKLSHLGIYICADSRILVSRKTKPKRQ